MIIWLRPPRNYAEHPVLGLDVDVWIGDMVSYHRRNANARLMNSLRPEAFLSK